jgi:hypothetical protein
MVREGTKHGGKWFVKARTMAWVWEDDIKAEAVVRVSTHHT